MEIESGVDFGRGGTETRRSTANVPLQRRSEAIASHAEAVPRLIQRGLPAFAQTNIARAPLVSFATRIIDASAIAAASVISGIAYHELVLNIVGDISEFLGVGILMAVLFTAIAQSTTSPQGLEGSNVITRASNAAFAWVAAFLSFVLISFLLKFGSAVSRGAILTFFFTGITAVVVSSIHTPRVLARLQLAGTTAKRALILLGSRGDPSLERLAEEIHSAICATPVIVTIDAHCPDDGWLTEQRQIVKKVLELARTSDPGEILLVTQEIPTHRVESLAQSLAPVPRSLLIIPDEKTASLLRHRIVTVGTGLAVEVQREPLNNFERCIKRGMDLLLASALMICLSPLLAAIAIGIKLDSSGPIFFRQSRLGYCGRVFKILKFRTMTTLEDGDSVIQAQKNDQRVTCFGRWLRRTSFDELPQLINVLMGDMSLVGPRPHAISHDNLYAQLIENYEIRQHVKPGITGWAQVHGLRGETSSVDVMSRRIEFDLWYAKNANLLLDFQILARTIFEVLRQRNAY